MQQCWISLVGDSGSRSSQHELGHSCRLARGYGKPLQRGHPAARPPAQAGAAQHPRGSAWRGAGCMRARARLQAGYHAVEGVGVDGVRAALLLAEAQDGRHKQHGLRDHAVRRAALQLAQPQQQLRQRACAAAASVDLASIRRVSCTLRTPRMHSKALRASGASASPNTQDTTASGRHSAWTCMQGTGGSGAV